MAVRELCIFPDLILRKKCRPVEAFDDQLQTFMDDLAESMYFHKGLGLAAPQIGEDIRAIVVDVEQKNQTPKLLEFVNPEILQASQELWEYEEGCLSFPQEAEKIKRPLRVTVRAWDRAGTPFELNAEGLLATALQHEIDHLNGILFVDRISRLKRSLVERRMKKRAQEKSRR